MLVRGVPGKYVNVIQWATWSHGDHYLNYNCISGCVPYNSIQVGEVYGGPIIKRLAETWIAFYGIHTVLTVSITIFAPDDASLSTTTVLIMKSLTISTKSSWKLSVLNIFSPTLLYSVMKKICCALMRHQAKRLAAIMGSQHQMTYDDTCLPFSWSLKCRFISLKTLTRCLSRLSAIFDEGISLKLPHASVMQRRISKKWRALKILTTFRKLSG